MKENNVKHVRRFALPVAALLSLTLAGCEQAVPCIVQYDLFSPYAVELTPVPNQTFDPSCPAPLQQPWVDVWNMERWGLTRGPTSPSSVGLRPFFFTDAYGEGEFAPSAALLEGDDYVCKVPSMNAISEGPVTYEISNLTFLQGSEFQGQAIKGDLTYTFGGSCVVNYTFQGMWPGLHGCNTDDECDAEHGLNPAIAFKCLIDPNWATPDTAGICMLANEFPSKK